MNPQVLVVSTSSGVGRIPIGATLKHYTWWLEMIGTDKNENGNYIHPLTISLTADSRALLESFSKIKTWRLDKVVSGAVQISEIQ